MVLFDTNIVIDMLNNQEDSNWKLLQNEDTVICGIVTAELYRGIKNKAEEKAVELFTKGVGSIQIQQNDWKAIGQFIAQLKQDGLTVPFQDAVIAWLCIKNGCSLKTKDRHFKMIAAVDERLVLE